MATSPYDRIGKLVGVRQAMLTLRKAAICYVRLGDFTSAQQAIKQCPPDQAPTQYLAFVLAVYQGESTESVACALRPDRQATSRLVRNFLLLSRTSYDSCASCGDDRTVFGSAEGPDSPDDVRARALD